MKQSLVLLSSAVVALFLFSSCKNNGGGTTAAAGGMTAQDSNKAGAKAFYEDVINAHNPGAVDKYCAVNFVDHNPDMGHSGQGLDDAKKSFGEWFASMPDAHITVDNMTADGDMVWVAYTMTGTMKGDMGPMKATNKAAKVGGMDLLRIKDGKAVERWGYYDQMSMMQQLGMMPAAPKPEEKKM